MDFVTHREYVLCPVVGVFARRPGFHRPGFAAPFNLVDVEDG